MLKDFRMLNVSGGFFIEENKFDFFPNEKDRLSFIYGKNGSGKSTLAKAFNNYKIGDLSVFSKVDFLGKDGNNLVLDENTRQQIYVFDENYTDNNIRFVEDGLNTIVMFGEQLKIDDNIKEKEEKSKRLTDELTILNTEREKYVNEKDVNSPDFHYNQIMDSLKIDNGWATREMNIKNLQRKSAVNKDIVKTVLESKPIESLEQLNEKLKETMNIISKFSSNENQIMDSVSKIDINQNYEKEIITLLGKKIEEPKTTPREEKILETIKNMTQTFIENAKITFSNKDTEVCPYCMQEITDEYKNKYIAEINNVLNKDVDEHLIELNAIQNMSVINGYDKTSVYNKIDEKLVNDIYNEVNQINICLKYYYDQIQEKKKNVFMPLKIDNKDFASRISNINGLLDKLEKKRLEYNQNIINKTKIIEDASQINVKIAYYETLNDAKSFYKQLNIRNKCTQKIDLLSIELTKIDDSLKILLQEKKNYRIALEKINKDLEYIFYCKDRLTLDFHNDKYIVKSHGKSVAPKDISAGERNIISLCYFFTQLLNNTQADDEYNNSILLVIDDPISSFDFENKIGIYSFLKNKFTKVLKNNIDTKVIVLTHELEAMFNFNKLAGEFKKELLTTSYLRLSNKKFDTFMIKKGNEYNRLINKVYYFAYNEDDMDEDYSIGNTMRKLLETFSTFEFRVGIEDITLDEKILGKLPNENSREYFEHLMYRLVLNNTSHTEERIKSLPETNFYEYVSIDEKKRTAKDILSFIYLLNPEHIEKQLDDNVDFISNIKTNAQAIVDK